MTKNDNSSDAPSRLANGDSAAFWSALSEGRLTVQRCAACGHVQHPPRHQCAKCWSDDLEQLACTGFGEVESVTVVRRAPLPQFRSQVPYVVGAVKLEEGPRMIATLVGERAMEVNIGDRVAVEIVPDEQGNPLPRFRPVAAG